VEVAAELEELRQESSTRVADCPCSLDLKKAFLNNTQDLATLIRELEREGADE
jgi:hypothetical protein